MFCRQIGITMGERMHIVFSLFVVSLVTTIDQIAATTTSKYNLHMYNFICILIG